MRKSPRISDPEVLELFDDDPGALVVVEAIVATQRAPVRAPAFARRRVIAVAAVVAAAAVAVGVLTKQESRAGVIGSALAALPHDRPLFISLIDSRPAATLIDLHTGRRTPVRHRLDEWFDARDGTYRTRDVVGGVVVSDVRSRRASKRTADVFAAAYLAALRRARPQQIEKGRSLEDAVYWLNVPGDGPLRAVAIDRTTFKPTLAVFEDGKRTRTYRVEALRVLTSAESVPPALAPAALRGAAIRRSRITDGGPLDLLARRVLTLPASGRLLWVRHVELGPDPGQGAEYVFGQSTSGHRLPARFTRVEWSTRPTPAFGWHATEAHALTRETALVVRTPTQTHVYAKSETGFFRIVTTQGESHALAVARAAIAA